MNSVDVCIRHLISHVEIELFGGEMKDVLLYHMNELAHQLEPITDYRTIIRKVTINGEPFTLLEMRA